MLDPTRIIFLKLAIRAENPSSCPRLNARSVVSLTLCNFMDWKTKNGKEPLYKYKPLGSCTSLISPAILFELDCTFSCQHFFPMKSCMNLHLIFSWLFCRAWCLRWLCMNKGGKLLKENSILRRCLYFLELTRNLGWSRCIVKIIDIKCVLLYFLSKIFGSIKWRISKAISARPNLLKPGISRVQELVALLGPVV